MSEMCDLLTIFKNKFRKIENLTKKCVNPEGAIKFILLLTLIKSTIYYLPDSVTSHYCFRLFVYSHNDDLKWLNLFILVHYVYEEMRVVHAYVTVKVYFPCCEPCDSRSAMIALRLSHGLQQGKETFK